jgi:hypothetical protein
MKSREGMFEAPIAGMSLTSELGATPWQHPPQYNTVEEALDYLNPDVKQDLLNVMEMGIPLTTIAQTLQMGGTMEGKHTIDVGILVTPVLVEMLAYLADTENIEYKSGLEPRKDKDSISDSEIAVAMRKVPEKIEEMKEIEERETSEPVDEPLEQAESKGLMARKA